ncbi:MAG: restriction endonuclease subunit S, partial [Gammaproteobacteria bacterium]|nr:restriction endonuclease subunit S [Gammaproteobacteria bacterium]
MKKDCYVDSGVPVIRGNNLSKNKFLVGDFVFISEKKADKLRSSNVFEGDLVFPHRGNIGKVGIIPGDISRYMLSSSLMKFSVNRGIADPLFVFYFFISNTGKHELLKNASQVGTPGIATPLTSLKSIRISLPSLPEQRAIAHILGTLDDKIENNRRMNATLEAMAQALFKSWFVDFDPVRAKTEGHEPEGMDADTAALFPDRLVDLELGEVPEGWEVGNFAGYADNIRNGTDPSVLDQDTPYIGLEHMPQKSIVLDEWDTAKKITSNKSMFEKGDILFGKLRPYFHKVGIPAISGICSTDILVIRPRHNDYRMFVLCISSSTDFVDYANLRSTGTRMPRANWKDIANYPVFLPDKRIIQEFNKITSDF